MNKILVGIICMFFCSSASAANITSNASVNILEDNLSLSETEQLNFGKILIPTSGTNIARVQRNGDYQASSTGVLGNFQSRGVILAEGNSNATILVTTVQTNSTIPGVSFTNLYKPNSTLSLNGSGKKNITIGGRITVDSTASAGVYNNGELSYEITVEYQ